MGSRSSVLCALGKMFQEKASAFGNVIVPEMLKALPMGFAHEVGRWFHKRFQGKCSAPEARKMLRLPSSRNLTREGNLDQRVQSDCADVSVCDVVRGPLLQEENDPMECDKSHGWRRKRSEQ